MTVEFEVASGKTGDTVEKLLIEPGSQRSIINYLPPAASIAICPIEDNHGVYEPSGELKFLKVDLVDVVSADKQPLSADKRIEFSGPQHLVISCQLHNEVVVLSHKKSQEKKMSSIDRGKERDPVIV